MRILILGLALTWTAVLPGGTEPAGAPGTAGTPETVTVRSGDLTLRGLLWRPVGQGPFPAVLFSHGSGPADYPQKPAAIGPVFARHGYLFLYLYRRGAGLSADQGTDSEELMSRAFKKGGQKGRHELQLQLLETELGDVLGGLAFLRARLDVDRGRIAAAGHSFGGSLSLLLAEREPGLRAVVLFGAATGSWDSSPELRSRLMAAAAHTSVPVSFIYAANDFSVAPAHALSAEMSRLGKPNQTRIYPSVGSTPLEGHDFYYLGLSTWEPDVFAFLDERTRP